MLAAFLTFMTLLDVVLGAGLYLHTGRVHDLSSYPSSLQQHTRRHLEEMSESDGHIMRQFLVHTEASVTAHAIEESVGIRPVAYLPINTWLLVTSTAVIAAARELPFVLFVDELPKEWKLSPSTNLVGDADGIVTLYASLPPPPHSIDCNQVKLDVSLSFTKSLLPCHVECVAGQKLMVEIHNGNGIESSALNQVVSILLQHHHIHFVHEKKPVTVLNHSSQWITQSNIKESLPVWANGIRGQNQIIGFVDSGLDVGHCYFADPTRDVQFREAADPSPFDTLHRKVVAYINFADDSDSENGHGTHVAGSIAGQSLNSTNGAGYYDGMAPMAKLAFMDIGKGGEPGLKVPDNYGQNLLGIFYDQGVRIHSNSWGGAANVYGTSQGEIDQYIYDHPDMVVLFAAGNDGDCGSYTVGAPADNKNGIAVGATRTPASDFMLKCQNDYTKFSSGCTETEEAIRDREGEQEKNAVFSSQGPTYDGRIKPDIMAPGHVIISTRSDAQSKANACSNDIHHAICGGGDCPDSTNLLTMSGTSMATPTLAGSVALIRQYLLEGFYPSGTKKESDSMNLIPASLVKSILIAGAENMPGLSPFTQGFGRYNAGSVLFFAASSKHKLFLAKDIKLLAGDKNRLCFSAPIPTKGIPFIAVMSYLDPPPALISSIVNVNSANLVVKTPGGTFYLGNNLISPKDGTAISDDLNNSERVSVDTYTEGVFEVSLHGIDVKQGEHILASLVVTGEGVGKVTCSAPNTCPNNCSNRGQCNSNTGVCVCNAGYQGSDCSNSICPSECSGHGTCLPTGICSCDSGWYNSYCSSALKKLTMDVPYAYTPNGKTTQASFEYTPSAGSEFIKVAAKWSPPDAGFTIYIVDKNGNKLCNSYMDQCNDYSATEYDGAMKVTPSVPIYIRITGGASKSNGCATASTLTISVKETSNKVCSGVMEMTVAPFGAARAWDYWEDGKTRTVDCTWNIRPNKEVKAIQVMALKVKDVGICSGGLVLEINEIKKSGQKVQLYSKSSVSDMWDFALGEEMNLKTSDADSYLQVHFKSDRCYYGGGFMQFNYRAMVVPTVTSLQPRLCYTSQVPLEVTGDGFYSQDGATTTCILGSNKLVSTAVSETSLRCNAVDDHINDGPEQLSVVTTYSTASGSVEVPSTATKQFEFVDDLFVVTSFSPTSGSFAGTAITVEGIEFRDEGMVVCGLTPNDGVSDVMLMKGVVISKTEVRCERTPFKSVIESYGVQLKEKTCTLSVSLDAGAKFVSAPGLYTISEEKCFEGSSKVCSGHGLCLGVCRCDPGYYGEDCSGKEPTCVVAGDSDSQNSTSTTGPPQSTTGPPQSTTGPPQSTTGPPQSTTGPPQSTTGPPQDYNSTTKIGGSGMDTDKYVVIDKTTFTFSIVGIGVLFLSTLVCGLCCWWRRKTRLGIRM